MAYDNSNLGDMHRGIRDTLKKHWWLLMVEGVVLIILGILAIAYPLVATIAVDIYVGWLFLIAGLVGLIALFATEDIAAFLWTIVTAALAVVLGVLLIWKPAAGAMTLTFALTAFFFAEGLFQVITSIAYRKAMPSSWFWLLASGLCDLILVAIIVAAWPLSAAWTLGLLAGVNLLTSGLAIVMVAMAARDVVTTVAASVATARR
jgi:uncharacterized membrane protein HdeD (DUF308 family)